MRVLLVSAALLTSSLAVADPAPSAAAAPWESPPLSATPSAIARAAHALATPAGADRQVLLDERVYHLAADGSAERRSHIVFRVLTAAGVTGGPGLSVGWQPWREARPQVRVRVIGPDGSSHALDPATIEDAGVTLGETLYSDSRVLRAPLPALSVGAVVEEEIVERHTVMPFVAGTALYTDLLANLYPTERLRVVIDAPAAMALRWSLHGPVAATPERRDAAGRTELTFTVGSRPALEVVAGASVDQVLPLLAFSTGGSWQDVARGYGRIAEAELAKTPRAELEKIARAALGGTPTSDRAKVAAALVAFVHREVRPVGIEFGGSSIVPHVPADTLQRKYGDCKDQALLLVGLLRAVGVPAQLALLRVLGVDVDEKLPGLERFDHVIVYVPGAQPLWIDPTDPWARVDELPPTDQGRLTLVVDPATRALSRTPLPPLGKNRMVATRTIALAESGPARVIETLELGGTFDRMWRTLVSKVDQKRVRQLVESTALAALGSDKVTRFQITDANRLDLPMRIEVEVADSSIASTNENGAEVTIGLSQLVDDLPEWMRKPEARSRGAFDLDVGQTTVTEWRFVVTAPPSLALEAIPPDRVVPLGPLRLGAQFTREPEGGVRMTLRLPIDKTRFSPFELEAIRSACKALASADPISLKFVDPAQVHLEAGRLREALDAYRKLIALHPNEALHHQRLAVALVGVGLGEAARAEAERAVALEPKEPGPQRTLSWMLEHDLIGRDFAPGFDRAAAEAALRKALALDAKNVDAYLGLGRLLEYDAEGRRFGSAAATAQALAAYRAIDKDVLERIGYADNPLWDLVNLHRWKELEPLTRGLPKDAEHARLRLLAVAAHSGVPAALTEAASYPSEVRATAIRDAAESLLWQRMYPQAAGLFERASHEPDAPGWVAPRADLARRVRRFEDITIDDRDPASAVRRFYVELLRPDDEANLMKRLRALGAAGGPALDEQDERSLLQARRSWRSHELPYEVVRDALVSIAVAEKEGDDHTGWRVRVTKPMNTGVDTEFVVRENGHYRMLALRETQVHIGHRVLDALAAKDFAAARRWLDWSAEFYRNGDSIDRGAPTPFARVWNPGGGGSPEQARVAALMLLVGRSEPDNKLALEGLRAVAAAPPPGVPLDAVDLVIARALLALDKPEEAFAVAAAAPEPASRLWFAIRATALTRLKRWSELRRAADAELVRVPEDAAALRALSRADQIERRWDAFDRDLQRLVASGRATPADYNERAWAALFRKGADEHALDDARRAAEMSNRRAGGVLHTLAALEAGLGRNREAYATLIESIDAGDGKPIPSDYYVLGRIAENLGLVDVAVAEYRKVVRKNPARPSPFDAAELAEARIRALGK
jgi:tetratricopeptide (TPR) repeat protein/transglutaminase-like putative cysteine protease